MANTVLSVNSYHYPRGGAEVVFLRQNSMLAAAGWSVVPFCMQHERNLPSEWSGYFVEELELDRETDGPVDRARKGLKAVYSFEAHRQITRVAERVAPDICHAHNVYHHLSPSVLGAVRNRGIPLVMTLHDLKLACPAYSMLTHDGVCERCRGGRLFHVATNRCMKGRTGLSLLVMVESYLHRFLGSYTANVDRFIVPSRFYLQKLVEWGFDAAKFRYLPNCVDASAFEAQFTAGRRFVYFGRLSPEKGVLTLLRAAVDAGVGLDFVGTGPLARDLRVAAAERGADVRFHGFLTGRELYERIATARAVVVPSEWYENAPLSVLEAFALGKPVIAADIGGLPELVVDGESGWTFESGSVASLTSCLRRVADLADADVEQLGMLARQRVAEQFSPRRHLDELRSLYGELGVTCQ